MIFKIRGQKKIYKSIKEIESDLIGVINPNSQKQIIIDWEWPYENGPNDEIDTKQGMDLDSYKFKITVTGEEVI